MNNTRVLIVEDRSDFQNIFIKIMKRLKFDYQVASSLRESLDLLKRFSFHIALIDLSLNDKDTNNRDGFKVLDSIKRLNEGTESIILTAYGKPKDADKIILEKYSLFGFIDKADMDVSEVASRIQEGAEKAKLEMYKPSKLLHSIDNILEKSYLEWIVKSIESNKKDIATSKYAEMEAFLKRLLIDVTPLLPHNTKEKGEVFRLDTGTRTVRNTYWSKALGFAIEMWIGPFETMRSIIQPVNESIYAKRAGYEKRIKHVIEKMEFPDYGGAIYRLQNSQFHDFEPS
jgi:CheY-like chemotaxis protein